MTDIKKKLFDHCVRFLDKRIDGAREAIRIAQESANEETKSSAGDKYETGRAMAQLEIEKNTTQLAEAVKQRDFLNKIDINRNAEHVQLGSLIITQSASFFMAVSIGRVELDGQEFAVVSPATPIGKLLHGRHVGSKFMFAGKEHSILKIY